MANKNGILLLGLGPGDEGLITREAWQVLLGAEEIYLRTSQHPAVGGLPERIKIHSFDYLYEQLASFEEVYSEIVKKVLSLANDKEIIYAVPGNPLVAESTGPEIFRQAMQNNIPIRVITGMSYIDPVLNALGIDPLPRLIILDAHELMIMHHPVFPPNTPALIAQVHSKTVASELKITLMSAYPDEHPVQFIHQAGTEAQLVEELKLYEIDQSEHIGLLSSLYMPALGEHNSLDEFQDLIAHLRSPDGCPWDREQTHQSLGTNLLEEAYEVLNAIDTQNSEDLSEELGDLLLQIVLHTQIAAEEGEFTMAQVLEGIYTKLVRRHPHVFGNATSETAEDALKNWEKIKANERSTNGKISKGILDGVPLIMPALAVADKYQKRAARVGFDWPEIKGVMDKIHEELQEFEQAENDQDRFEELGDLLFAVANLARWVKVDPEAALRATNTKFKKRFSAIEAEALRRGIHISEMSLDEMEAIWQKNK